MLVSGTFIVNNSTPTLIVDGSSLGECMAHIQCSADTVIGDSGVTTTNGLLIVPGGTNSERNFTVRLQSEQLYAVSVGANAAVGVLAYTT